MMSGASPQGAGAKRPPPWPPPRRNGLRSRPGPCTQSGYDVATLVQITPAVYGFGRGARTRTIRAFSTVTERLQVSGQSRGQTLACSVVMALIVSECRAQRHARHEPHALDGPTAPKQYGDKEEPCSRDPPHPRH